MPTEGTLKVGVKRLPLQHLRRGDEVKIKVAKDSAVFVRQGDYVLIDDDTNSCRYLETDGAPVCVCIAIRGNGKTLLAHLDEDTNEQGKGTRANQDLHEILTDLLDMVSTDYSDIDAIGLCSGSGFHPNRDFPRHADEVLADLMARNELTCEIGKRKATDMLVDLRKGNILVLPNQLDESKFSNVNNKEFGGYPDDCNAGTMLDLVTETEDENDEQNEQPSLEENQLDANPVNPEEQNDEQNAEQNDEQNAEQNDEQNADKVPDIETSGANDNMDAPADGGGDMDGGFGNDGMMDENMGMME